MVPLGGVGGGFGAPRGGGKGGGASELDEDDVMTELLGEYFLDTTGCPFCVAE